MDRQTHQPTFIDLFCGCGGFTLGLTRAGFHCVAAIDFNEVATQVLEANKARVGSLDRVLTKDLITFEPEELAEMIGVSHVDVIVGGPPCQGFSTARQRDGANHGQRLKDDPRRSLYQRFLAYVAYFKPRVFVMENVLGIRTAAAGAYFSAVQEEARELGYVVTTRIENCVDLGVPQKRRRQLIIGTPKEEGGYFRAQLERPRHAPEGAMLGDAIGDLPPLTAGEGDEARPYDLALRHRHVAERGQTAVEFLYNVLEVDPDGAGALTAHRSRPHNERDIELFRELHEGESSATAMRDPERTRREAPGEKLFFPYNRETFQDRFTRQHRDRPCSTIVAHLSKDGLMFIHPTQDRSLTPREAARVQTFPDWFKLPVTRTHQFRVIGNAVPPLVGEAVGWAVRKHLDDVSSGGRVPASASQALAWLKPLLDLSPRDLRRCPEELLKRGWAAVAYLFPGLHPDEATNLGDVVGDGNADAPDLPGADPRLHGQYDVRSGWPLVLTGLAAEATRRYEGSEWGEEDFYCVDAQRAGLGLPTFQSDELG